MAKQPKKKIVIRQIYEKPNSGTVIVHFEFPDLNYRSNMNFNPRRFEGMTKDQIMDEIKRNLQNYRQQLIDRSATKPAIDTAISELEGYEES